MIADPYLDRALLKLAILVALGKLLIELSVIANLHLRIESYFKL